MKIVVSNRERAIHVDDIDYAQTIVAGINRATREIFLLRRSSREIHSHVIVPLPLMADDPLRWIHLPDNDPAETPEQVIRWSGGCLDYRAVIEWQTFDTTHEFFKWAAKETIE